MGIGGRSTPSIVNWGNSIVGLLHRHFPHSIDYIKEEASNTKSDQMPLPLVLMLEGSDHGVTGPTREVLMGASTSLRQLDFAIIVRGEQGRTRVKEAGVEALVLTIGMPAALRNQH